MVHDLKRDAIMRKSMPHLTAIRRRVIERLFKSWRFAIPQRINGT
jgi:hypothetical protein